MRKLGAKVCQGTRLKHWFGYLPVLLRPVVFVFQFCFHLHIYSPYKTVGTPLGRIYKVVSEVWVFCILVVSLTWLGDTTVPVTYVGTNRGEIVESQHTDDYPVIVVSPQHPLLLSIINIIIVSCCQTFTHFSQHRQKVISIRAENNILYTRYHIIFFLPLISHTFLGIILREKVSR